MLFHRIVCKYDETILTDTTCKKRFLKFRDGLIQLVSNVMRDEGSSKVVFDASEHSEYSRGVCAIEVQIYVDMTCGHRVGRLRGELGRLCTSLGIPEDSSARVRIVIIPQTTITFIY